MQVFFGWLSQVVLAMALPYFLISLVLGVCVARRNGLRLGSQEAGPVVTATRASGHALYFLVPCLNEEVVVTETVRRLLAEPGGVVVVIDDGSTDRTADRAEAAAGAAGAADRLIVVSRSGARSRQGKGEALNAAFPVVTADVSARGLDPQQVIVVVMDADGRLSAGAVAAATEPFSDDRVGGVQLVVRIRERDRLIAQFQDIEFWMISALSQFARSISGTVSLGGNGQFTRLSALQALSDAPWSRSLTEDLDLGLRLIEAGWRITTTPHTYVDQQAVDTIPRLLRQRTRWYQGHMGSIRRLQWIVYQIVAGSGRGVFADGLGGLSWQVTYGVLWYLLSFAPNLVIGVIYPRRTRAVSLTRALVLGHLMIVWNYVGYVAAWRAVGRLAVGRNDWTKTARTPEPLPG